jgi:hypothetical protein
MYINSLRTDGDFWHQGQDARTCQKDWRNLLTWLSLESSWGALSDGTISFWIQPFTGENQCRICRKISKIPKPTCIDMTIHWKALEEHFPNGINSFRMDSLWEKSSFWNFHKMFPVLNDVIHYSNFNPFSCFLLALFVISASMSKLPCIYLFQI